MRNVDFVYLFCLWVCFVRLFDVIKDRLLPYITYYDYCHSLDGAILFSNIDSNKLGINVRNKMTLIGAKFDADLADISEVTSRKTK